MSTANVGIFFQLQTCLEVEKDGNYFHLWQQDMKLEEKNNFRQVFIVHKQQQSRRSLLQRKNILLTLVSSRLCQELERYLGIWLGSAWKHALCIYGPSGWSQIDKKNWFIFKIRILALFVIGKLQWQTYKAWNRQDRIIKSILALQSLAHNGIQPLRYTRVKSIYRRRRNWVGPLRPFS